MLGTSPTLNESHSNSAATNSIPEFVKKLFGMLEDNTYPQIFSWGTEGDTFVVKDPNEFARHILPKHFKHSNFASFVRQLNKYDFHKLRMPEDGQRIYGDQAWEFQHPNFKYNRRELLEDIKRKPTGKAAQQQQQQQQQASAAASGSKSSTASTTNNKDSTTTSNALEEELKTITTNLQKEIHNLKETQKKMTDKVKLFDKKYSIVLDNIQGFKKNMQEQDILMREIMSYVSTNKGSNLAVEQDLEQIINTYHTVASTGESQLEKLSEVIVGSNVASDNNVIQQQQQQQQLLNQQLQQQQQQIQQQQQQQQQMQQQQQQQNTNNNAMIPVISTSSLTPARKRKRIQPGWSVPPRVLLVDDDSIFRRLSTRLLQIAGCQIDVAVDGMEAVRKLGSGKYDLVLMDIMMPKLDGMSATRNIRQYDTWTPIISMTSNTTDQDIQQYFMSGMTDVLPKPLNQGTLGNLLERYCAHLVVQRQHQQQLHLLQQNYSLNGSLINLNQAQQPQLTLIEDNTEDNAAAASSNSVYTTASTASTSATIPLPTTTTTITSIVGAAAANPITTATPAIMYSTPHSNNNGIIPRPQQQQLQQQQLLLNQQQQQQQWYLYAVNQKRSKIDKDNSIQQ